MLTVTERGIKVSKKNMKNGEKDEKARKER